MVNSVFSLTISKTGKSSLGRVEIEYFPEPDSINNLSPFKQIEISDPSGKSLQSSLSFFAGAVVEPVLSTLVGAHVVFTSDSRSVAVIAIFLSSTVKRILDRIGNACLFSTTPRVEDKALTISVLLTVNFISL